MSDDRDEGERSSASERDSASSGSTDGSDASGPSSTDQTDTSDSPSIDGPDASETHCEQCGDPIETNEWYPVTSDRDEDGSLQLYQFCTEDCQSAWLDERSG